MAALRAQLPNTNLVLVFGSFVVGIAATALLLDFANDLGFRIPIPYFLLFSSLVIVIIFFLPERYPWIVSQTARLANTYPIQVLVVVSGTARLIYGVSMSLFPDEYTVLDLLRRIPVSDLGGFLNHYTEYALTLSPHPPLSFLIMLIGYLIYPSAISVRLVSALFSTASVIIVYKIVLELGRNKEALPAALLYALVPHSLMFMDLALTDVYMNFFGMLCIWLMLKAFRIRGPDLALLSGVSLGLSFWSKQGLPFFWAGLLMIVALVFRGKMWSFRGRCGYLALAYSAGAAIFTIWFLLNPRSFFLATYSFVFLIIIAINPSAYQLFSKNIPVVTQTATNIPVVTQTAGTITQPFVACYGSATDSDLFASLLAQVFPKLCKGGQSFISLGELIIQIPFWITPLILLFAIAGVVRKSGRTRTDLIMTVWALVPPLAMVPFFRDARYLVLFSPALAYLAVRGISLSPRHLERRLLALALTFTLIFAGAAFVVGQQQYYGPPQAVQKLQQLGLENGPLLTNWVALQFQLPKTVVHEVYEAGSVNAGRNLMVTLRIRAAVFFYNARASPQSPNQELREAAKVTFPQYYREGPSDFAWFEIFYRSGTEATQLNFPRQDWASLSYSALGGPISAGDMLVLTSWDVSQNYQRQLREQGAGEQGAKVLQPLIELKSR